MYICVRLLNGFTKSLTYRVPQQLVNQNLVGHVVLVPLRKRSVHALVHKQFEHADNDSFIIRDVESLDALPADQLYWQFIAQLSAYHQIEPISLLARLEHFLNCTPKISAQANVNYSNTNQSIELTPAQAAIFEKIAPLIGAGQFKPCLLHGVTGSGKSEIYKKLMFSAYERGLSSLFLLPEVSLATTFTHNLRHSLPVPIFDFHSASTTKEKRALWNALKQQQPCIIIGVHLPVMLPIGNLGLIVIDEEHESGYQEKKHPHINSKEAAIMRASIYQIPIVLGSATPSLNSLHNVHTRDWHFFQLHARYMGTFARVQIVSLANEPKRPYFWLSKKLEYAIADRLEKHEQTIIFINRRGFCFFVRCGACTHIFNCTRCSVSLTLHEPNQLVCHYCGINQILPDKCPKCANPHLIKKGIGTQQVVKILETIFPAARIARADLDTSKKHAWQETVTAFTRGDIDIFVGTQTITKGYHFPRVTLVGIIWADVNLHMPVFTAAERTLQQIIQVAGRAGRSDHASDVIVQTLSDHTIFQYTNETDYLKFCDFELEQRRFLGYPPCGRFAQIELIHAKQEVVEREARFIAHHISRLNIEGLTVLGPTPPPVEKIKGSHRQRVYFKAQSMQTIYSALQMLKNHAFNSSLHFSPTVTP